MNAATSPTGLLRPRPAGGDWLDRRPRLLLAILVVLFVAAALVRSYRIDAPGMLMDREYNSAIVARNFHFSRAADVEPWRRELAQVTRDRQPGLEPPVTEWLVSLAYSLTGAESFRYARVLTSFCWLLGGWFLFLVARSLVSTDAAVFALGYYLLLPMSVLLSRSFQPDALMMLMFLASLWGVVRYHELPSGKRLVAAMLVTAATVLYRPIVLFALAAAFVFPLMQRRGIWRGAVSGPSIAYGLASVLPALAYYSYETLVTGRFGNQLTLTFRPYLWGEKEYWQGWFDLATSAIGVPALMAAVVGYTLLRPGLPRAIVAGLGLAYIVFGLLFTMHIHTHDYYQAQLIPLIAIAASPLIAILARQLLVFPPRWYRLLAVTVLAGVVALPWWRELNRTLDRAELPPPEVAGEIGRLVGHSQRVVFIARYYGVPLQYSAELTGSFWPRPITYHLHRDRLDRPLSIAERLDALGFEPEYFVITNFREFERHHQDLAAYLDRNCEPKAQTPAYLVYERCQPPDALKPGVA